MDTFLAPIERHKGLIMKLAYLFTRRQFGKVLTPLRVHSARLPPAFGLFYSKIGKLDKKLLLPPETAMLIREQVARINVCLFCVGIGRWRQPVAQSGVSHTSMRTVIVWKLRGALEASPPQLNQISRLCMVTSRQVEKSPQVASWANGSHLFPWGTGSRRYRSPS
jgi:hypothetical protein